MNIIFNEFFQESIADYLRLAKVDIPKVFKVKMKTKEPR